MNADDYKSGIKPVWCPGCGDHGVLTALIKTFAKLEIPRQNIAVLSGIGCSSRITGYLSTYGLNGIHGRALPIAQGYKLARPDMTVLAVGGDGDLFSIGTGHLPHAARRNIDITCIMLDNQAYAMTKGQTSPTTPHFCDSDHRSIRTSQALNPEVDPLLDMLTFGTKFVAQGFAFNVPHLMEVLEAAILYKGFSFVSIQSPCVSFQEKEWTAHLKKDGYYLKAGEPVELPSGESWLHDPSNKNLARRLVEVPLRVRPYYGIIYRE